jgi:surface polysaccharide O-acyltransferase-like enzyme
LIKPGHVFNAEYYDPYYQLWYLVSMTVWYLLAVFIKNSPLKNVNKSILVLGFFIIGIASKYITPFFELWMKNYYSKFDSNILGYQRTLSFLPFFFLGLYFTEENMNKLYQKLQDKKLLAVAVVVGIFAYVSLTDSTNMLNIFKGSCGINLMEGSLLFITGRILIGYLIALVMCFLILSLKHPENS